jgi:hypothetical protein
MLGREIIALAQHSCMPSFSKLSSLFYGKKCGSSKKFERVWKKPQNDIERESRLAR